MKTLIFLSFYISIILARPFGIHETLTPKRHQRLLDSLQSRGGQLPVEHNATVKIDHYNNMVTNDTTTFQLRYLVND